MKNPTSRVSMLALIAGSLCACAATGHAQETATYTGPNNGFWNDPANWDLGVVPANTTATSFNAIIPATTVNFDMGAPTEVVGFSLATNGRLNVGTGEALAVAGVSVLGGMVDVSGAGSMFFSDSPFTVFTGSRPLVHARNGGIASIGAVSYSHNTNASDVIFLADGMGSLLDLSSLASISVALSSNSGRTSRIQAIGGGIIDLSGTTSIVGPTSSNVLAITINPGSDIDLSALETAQANTRFEVRPPTYSLPALQTTSGGINMDVATGSVLTAASWSTAEGTTLTIADGGAIEAPALLSFTNSVVNLNPLQTLTAPLFTSINNSRFSVSGGRQFAVAAPGYANSRNSSDVIFRAAGNDSLLDMASLESISVTLSSNSGRTFRIDASGGGVVDLSGTTTLTGPTSSNVLVLTAGPNGDVKLPALQTTQGNIRVEGRVSAYTLPSLHSASGTTFDVSIFNRITLPALTSMTSGVLAIQDGGRIEAPLLTSFTNSVLQLNPSRFLDAPLFTNIDNSRFAVTDGRQFAVAAAAYLNNRNASDIIFRADGTASLLDLSSLGSVNVSLSSNSGRTFRIDASSAGKIDLSGTTAIGGPGSSNILVIRAEDGGRIEVGGSTITGRTRLEASGSASRLDFGGILDMRNPQGIILSFVATLGVAGNFTFNHTDPATISMGDGRLHMNGDSIQTLEVAGEDLGLPSGAIPANFQIGQLIVGQPAAPTNVQLIDEQNNGNRGPLGEPEVLYLQGFPAEDGLRIHPGSVLYLNNLDLYVVINNDWVHINALFGPGITQIPFDEGHINIGQYEPCYANCDGSITPPVLTVDDFTCFINRFASAQALSIEEQITHYANCDGSTTPPILTVDDFTCFINAFAAGCP